MERRKCFLTMLKCILCFSVNVVWVGSVTARVMPQSGLYVEGEWDTSGYFHQGENIALYFVQHGDWSYPYYTETVIRDTIKLPAKTLVVNITNVELNNYTKFDVTLVPPPSRIPIQEPYNFVLIIYDIEVTHHGGLIIEDSPDEIGGVAPNDGIYIANCCLLPPVVIDKYPNGTIYHHPVSPPLELEIVPEFPALLTPLLFMTATLFAVVLYKRKYSS